MEISVVIPTYNGEKKISRLLDALLKQTFKEFNVVVVIDGSTDRTEEVLQGYQNRFKNLRVLLQQNQGRAGARNHGAALINSGLLIFFDDDVIPQPDSVMDHVQFHQKNYGILGGNPVELEESEKTDVQNYRAAISKKWLEKYPSTPVKLSESTLFFAAANCSMGKEIFNSLNGFDERLPDAEDFDLACRALQQGVQVFFHKTNEVVHHDPITLKSYIKRQRQYNLAHKVLSDLHPERKRPPSSSKLKHFLYWFFASSYLPALIDNYAILKFLPKRMRYLVYSIVIHSLSKEYPNLMIK